MSQSNKYLDLAIKANEDVLELIRTEDIEDKHIIMFFNEYKEDIIYMMERKISELKRAI